jgi:CBS domain-containing protein
MRATDLMTVAVQTVHPETPAKEAARLLVAHGFTALPVVDGVDHLVGVVTEADLIRNRILPDPRALIGDSPPPAAAPSGRSVADVMTADPVSVTPTTDAVAVGRLMLDRHLRALPVVDGDRLAGIITRRDMLRAIARDDHTIAHDIRHRLAIASDRRWDVEVADGVVTLTCEGADPTESHLATVVASALPGVQEVRVADALGD